MTTPTEPEEPKVERWEGWLREMAPCDRFWKRLERDEPEEVCPVEVSSA